MILGLSVALAGVIHAGSAAATERSSAATSVWNALIEQAQGLGLPTRFLRLIPPGFVRLEFEDLHAFAAEYHPEEHRMVLNRTLSFNAAGGVLRPLITMTHRDLGTLYHELFHAYMDYLKSSPDEAAADPNAARLLAFAGEQQQCRYQTVAITPVLQRKSATETRYLTDRESWEALNETWAVFVGWVTWTRLELSGASSAHGSRNPGGTEGWLKRLQKTDREGDLIGYYEPEDPAERMIARKRYLAPSHRISPREVAILLELLFEEPAEQARRSAAVMERRPGPFQGGSICN
ncbi:MAG: hypothetical protein ACREIL_09195 [Nitrospiraceae bacterium]